MNGTTLVVVHAKKRPEPKQTKCARDAETKTTSTSKNTNVRSTEKLHTKTNLTLNMMKKTTMLSVVPMMKKLIRKMMMMRSWWSGAFPCHMGGETAGCHMISGAGLCWQHVGGVGSTTTT